MVFYWIKWHRSMFYDVIMTTNYSATWRWEEAFKLSRWFFITVKCSRIDWFDNLKYRAVAKMFTCKLLLNYCVKRKLKFIANKNVVMFKNTSISTRSLKELRYYNFRSVLNWFWGSKIRQNIRKQRNEGIFSYRPSLCKLIMWF